jgi:hypothetical protein
MVQNAGPPLTVEGVSLSSPGLGTESLEIEMAGLSLAAKGKGATTRKPLSAAEIDIIKTKEPLYGLVSGKVPGSRIRLALVSLIVSRRVQLPTNDGVIGKRCEPVHEETTYRAVQEDFGSKEEAPCLRTDGRVLEHL